MEQRCSAENVGGGYRTLVAWGWRLLNKLFSFSTFTSIVHAFVSSRLGYFISLFVVLPMIRLSPLQTQLNAAARLIARLIDYQTSLHSHLNILHWLPLSERIQLEVQSSVLKDQLGIAKSIFVILFFAPSALRFVRFSPLAHWTSLFPASEHLWLNLQAINLFCDFGYHGGFPPPFDLVFCSIYCIV